jgi:serine/threonine-protein phosphatase 2A regulatory subunit B''
VMRLGIWWSEPLRIILIDLLGCQQGGTIASMFIDKHGFWAHDNWENLLQDDKEAVEAPEESEYYLVCTHFQIETF